jgi:hypothetical protein
MQNTLLDKPCSLRNNHARHRKLAVCAIFLVAVSAVSMQVSHANQVFVHPGGANGKVELDQVRQRIQGDASLWSSTGKYAPLRALATPYVKTQAPCNVQRCEEEAKADAKKAYANALAWYYTGEAQYADNAMQVFRIWANDFEGYKVVPGISGQSQLNAGWIGALLGSAAEVLRSYSGWSHKEQAAVKSLFATRFYPALHQESEWNGNNDLTQIDALMNIAVFSENEAWLNEAKDRLKRRNPRFFYLPSDVGIDHRSTNPSWFSPMRWVAGVTQETCRTNAKLPNDNGHHTQYAMASALRAAEVAWNQGDRSVYGLNQLRYTAAMELLALQVLSGDMQGVCADPKTTASLFDTWMIGYNHYYRRMGIPLPNTQKLLKNSESRVFKSDWNIFYESLTHGE